MNEIESLMKRYNSYEGVEKILIIHSVKSEDTINSAVMKKIYKVKDENELTFIRIKTTNHELLFAPNNNYFFCVLQNLTSES